MFPITSPKLNIVLGFFIIEILSDVRRSKLAIFWWFAESFLVVAAIFLAIAPNENKWDFFLYLVLGKFGYNLFAKSIMQSCWSLRKYAAQIQNIYLELPLVIAGVTSANIVRAFAPLIFCIVLLGAMGKYSLLSALVLIASTMCSIIIIFLVGNSLSRLLVPHQSIFPIISVIFLCALFVSGVFIPISTMITPSFGEMSLIANPIATYIAVLRETANGSSENVMLFLRNQLTQIIAFFCVNKIVYIFYNDQRIRREIFNAF